MRSQRLIGKFYLKIEFYYDYLRFENLYDLLKDPIDPCTVMAGYDQ